MLGRRSSLMGALVQAIHVAIHATIEHKTSKERKSIPIQTSREKEVIPPG